MLPFLVPVLFTFYIQGVLRKLKKFGCQKVKFSMVEFPPDVKNHFRGSSVKKSLDNSAAQSRRYWCRKMATSQTSADRKLLVLYQVKEKGTTVERNYNVLVFKFKVITLRVTH
jgi:hypothetical protein